MNKILIFLLSICIPFLLQAQCEADAGTIVEPIDFFYCENDILSYTIEGFNESDEYTQIYARGYYCDLFTADYIGLEPEESFVAPDFPGISNYYVILALNVLTSELPEEIDESVIIEAEFNLTCYDFTSIEFLLEDCNPLQDANAGEFNNSQNFYCLGETIPIETMDYNDDDAYSQIYSVQQLNSGNETPIFNNQFTPQNAGTYVISAANFPSEYHPNQDPCIILPIFPFEDILSTVVYYDLVTDTITVLNPIEVTTSYEFSEDSLSATLGISVGGGLPEYTNENGGESADFLYTILGDITAEFSIQENIVLEIPPNECLEFTVYDNLGCQTNITVLPTDDFDCNCTPNAGNFTNTVDAAYCADSLVTFETNGFYEADGFVQQYVLADENGDIVSINNTGAFTPTPNTYIGYALNIGGDALIVGDYTNIQEVFDNLSCYDVVSTDIFEVLESTDPACFCYADAGTFTNTIATQYCLNELINVQTTDFYEGPDFLQQYVLTDENGIVTDANTTGEFTPDANTYIAYAINTGDNFDVIQNSIGTPLDVILSFPSCYDIIASEPITIISCAPFGYGDIVEYAVDSTTNTYMAILYVEGGDSTSYTSQDGTFNANVFTSNPIDCEENATITIEAPLIEPLVVEVESPCISTSINRVDISTNLTIHPIPTTNQLNIAFTPLTSQNITIQIFDLLGQIIWEESTQAHNNLYKNTLNIQDWSAGLYLLKIKQGDNTTTKRFVKK